MKTTYVNATLAIQKIIANCPADGMWHEVSNHTVCIDGNSAGIYLPGSPASGECDIYVDGDETILEELDGHPEDRL